MAKEKPGVLLYFDAIEPWAAGLHDEQFATLIRAVIEYAHYGSVPTFDGILKIAWETLKPRIDADGERYKNQIDQRSYAVYSREAQKRGESVISFEQWKRSRADDRPISTDNDRYQPTSDDIQLQLQHNSTYPNCNYSSKTSDNDKNNTKTNQKQIDRYQPIATDNDRYQPIAEIEEDSEMPF